jgi:phosphatidylglycerophosphate synthase
VEATSVLPVVLPVAVTLTCLAGLLVAVRRGLRTHGDRLGPADLVTLTRAALACVCAGLVTTRLGAPPAVDLLAGLAATSLALDLVDGRVARRTGTGTRFGARFDGEADAWLMLVLSVYVASWWGGWVLALGLVRYVFGAAGAVLPWLRDELPPRPWRKVVTATAGIALVAGTAGVLGDRVTTALLAVAAAMLAESFGRDVLWLWRHRRHRHDAATLPARAAAYGPGEFVGQESFVRASEVLAIAAKAGVGPGVSVLDVCCGVGGPGTHVVRSLGGHYLGVDASASAVSVARRRARGLDCRFEVARVPPFPAGTFDVVLLLETMLAFRGKDALVGAVAGALPPGGRFAFTVEVGEPLTGSERAAMPAADTVWPIREARLDDLLARHGLRVVWSDDHTAAHGDVAAALAAAYADPGLVASHALWRDWLTAGRIRKLAVVAERVGAPG